IFFLYSLLPNMILQSHLQPRHLHSFPTRRSSDLKFGALQDTRRVAPNEQGASAVDSARDMLARLSFVVLALATTVVARARTTKRSEEHTSELQSRRDLVCRLLLEKKKRMK